LFDWPELPAALDRWLGSQTPAVHVLVAGGGPLVEAIRQANRVFSFDEEAAHWLCIDAMGITAKMIALSLDHARVVGQLDELRQIVASQIPECIVFDPGRFLRKEEPACPGCVLAEDWSVTSDSIAARLAEVLNADELVLLKSAEPPSGSDDLRALAEQGYVDRQFPAFERKRFSYRFVNLRACQSGGE